MTDERHYRPDAGAPKELVNWTKAKLRLESGEPIHAGITAIEIENFKGIGQPVRVELRPITLLFGSNSAGKSTILHALCYAHELLSHRNVDVHTTELGGDQIDLGGFRNFVHGRDLKLAVRLRFEFDMFSEDVEYSEWAPGEFDEPPLVGESGWVELVVEWKEGAAIVGSYAVGIDGTIVGRISARGLVEAKLEANLSHPLLAGSVPGPGGEEFPDGAKFEYLTLWGGSALPNFDRHLEIHGCEWVYDLPRLKYRVSTLLVVVGRVLRREVAKLRYIGPWRDLKPPDHLGRESRRPWSDDFVQKGFYGAVTPGQRRWANGSAAWKLLNEDAGRAGLTVRETSRWLSRVDRLDTGYKLRVRSVVVLPGDEPLVAGILDSKQPKKTSSGSSRPEPEANPSSGDILRAADPSLVDALAERIREGVRKRVEIVSTRIDRPVRTSDIGVGISQVLPVVVAALDPARPGITAVEQPELHVHPRLQVELGDLFAQGVDQGGVFLIETHSEHLMLRLLRRIEETHSGDLPDGKPSLKPDQVSVVFVEQVGGDVRATPLRIDETGEFKDRWPHGFFEERDDELF